MLVQPPESSIAIDNMFFGVLSQGQEDCRPLQSSIFGLLKNMPKELEKELDGRFKTMWPMGAVNYVSGAGCKPHVPRVSRLIRASDWLRFAFGIDHCKRQTSIDSLHLADMMTREMCFQARHKRERQLASFFSVNQRLKYWKDKRTCEVFLGLYSLYYSYRYNASRYLSYLSGYESFYSFLRCSDLFHVRSDDEPLRKLEYYCNYFIGFISFQPISKSLEITKELLLFRWNEKVALYYPKGGRHYDIIIPVIQAEPKQGPGDTSHMLPNEKNISAIVIKIVNRAHPITQNELKTFHETVLRSDLYRDLSAKPKISALFNISFSAPIMAQPLMSEEHCSLPLSPRMPRSHRERKVIKLLFSSMNK